MEHQAMTLNVLGYKEEGQWVALALEMDLRGYGETFDEAVEDLADLVKIQISFSRFKGQPELIWKPADAVWFGLFAQARRDYLDALIRQSDLPEPEYGVAGLPIPPAHVIEAMRSEFVPSEA
jgi:hypothetical protein